MGSTSIAVGHKQRITRDKVIKGEAKRGKTTSGWLSKFQILPDYQW
ncbi:hypothetical protein NEOC65_000788 [Neochlamydia sp. AcF65]|nr:hypothetical protein [Neochlamydia sp. AcF65]